MTTDKGTLTEPVTEPAKTTEPTQPAPPTDVAANGEGKDPIPYDRFQTVNQQKNDALKRLEELEKAETERQTKAKEATEKQLKEQEKFAELADQYKAELETEKTAAMDYKAKVEKYETVLLALYEARKTAVPEMYQPLLDNLDLAARLEWIATNEDKLKPQNGSNGIPPTPSAKGVGDLTPDQKRAKAKRTW